MHCTYVACMRYIVVGTSGAGKSTFAAALAQACDLLGWSCERPDYRDLDALQQPLGDVEARIHAIVKSCEAKAATVAADGRALARAVRVAGKIEPVFVESIEEMPGALMDVVRDGDVVIGTGAGSIGQLPARLAGGGAE